MWTIIVMFCWPVYVMCMTEMFYLVETTEITKNVYRAVCFVKT